MTERLYNVSASLSMIFVAQAYRAAEQFSMVKVNIKLAKIFKISIWHA
jgi:hypothetical protein